MKNPRQQWLVFALAVVGCGDPAPMPVSTANVMLGKESVSIMDTGQPLLGKDCTFLLKTPQGSEGWFEFRFDIMQKANRPTGTFDLAATDAPYHISFLKCHRPTDCSSLFSGFAADFWDAKSGSATVSIEHFLLTGTAMGTAINCDGGVACEGTQEAFTVSFSLVAGECDNPRNQ